jgi:hypothetical protein
MLFTKKEKREGENVFKTTFYVIKEEKKKIFFFDFL